MAMLMMLLLQYFFPAKKKPAEPNADNPVVQNDADQDPADDEEDPGEEQPAIQRTGIDPSIAFLTNTEIKDLGTQVGETAALNAYYNQRSLTSVRQQGDLITIGSLNQSGSDRYLITLNPYGGTIRRIELNLRDPKTGDFKYRDLEWKGGYIGALECYDTKSNQVIVGVVGPGTPAEMATAQGVTGGIQKGDVLESFDGEKITSAEDFMKIMASTHPGDEATLVVDRAGQSLSFSTTLTTKPIELIRPEPGVLSPTAQFDESFLLRLYKPDANLNPQVEWVEIDKDIAQSQWEVVSADAHSAQLKFEVSPQRLKELDLAGPISVTKSFSVPELAEDEIQSRDAKSFDWDFDLKIENGSAKNQKIGYELKGPTGTPSETWWYSQKTHGDAYAISKIGGARDVLASTTYDDFIFYGCMEIVKETLKDEPVTKFVTNPFETTAEPTRAEINWLGVDTLYFNTTLFPKTDQGQKFTAYSVFADVNDATSIPENARTQKLVDCTFRVFRAVDAPANGSVTEPFEVFSGPKETALLATYGLEDTRVFGWFWWCSKPLLSLLHLFYFLTFKISYIIPIILLTVLVRCLMIPFSRKAALNAQMMQYLQPQIKEIADKHVDDMEGRAKAQQDLFKKYNYSPLSGCFIGLIQLPVFIGLYRGLSVDISLRDQPIVRGMSWASNLSGPDQLYYWKHLWPSWLAEDWWFGPFLNILPLVTMVLFLVQQKLFTPPAMDEQQQMMQKMMSFMMLFMALMFFKVPAGLCVYFVTSSIWGILERKLLPKPVLDTDGLDDQKKPKTSLAERGMALLQSRKSDAVDQARSDLEQRKKRNRDRKKKLKKK